MEKKKERNSQALIHMKKSHFARKRAVRKAASGSPAALQASSSSDLPSSLSQPVVSNQHHSPPEVWKLCLLMAMSSIVSRSTFSLSRAGTGSILQEEQTEIVTAPSTSEVERSEAAAAAAAAVVVTTVVTAVSEEGATAASTEERQMEPSPVRSSPVSLGTASGPIAKKPDSEKIVAKTGVGTSDPERTHRSRRERRKRRRSQSDKGRGGADGSSSPRSGRDSKRARSSDKRSFREQVIQHVEEEKLHVSPKDMLYMLLDRLRDHHEKVARKYDHRKKFDTDHPCSLTRTGL